MILSHSGKEQESSAFMVGKRESASSDCNASLKFLSTLLSAPKPSKPRVHHASPEITSVVSSRLHPSATREAPLTTRTSVPVTSYFFNIRVLMTFSQARPPSANTALVDFSSARGNPHFIHSSTLPATSGRSLSIPPLRLSRLTSTFP